MKHLVHVNYDSLSNLDKMKAIKKVVSDLEIKILVNSELGNDDIMNQYSSDLKELNLLYLDLMAEQDEFDAKCQAFESFLDAQLSEAV
jgi:hypothetical protein